MMEKIPKCPVCGHREFRTYLEGKDYFLSHEQFTIVTCAYCGFRFTNPRPDFSSVANYYRSDDYLSHGSRKNGIIPTLYKIARIITVRSKYRLIRRYSTGNTLLDIGCGTGEFLSYCRKKGLRVSGVEPFLKARESAIRKHRLNVVSDFLEDIPSTDRFDCITLWHVLEHIHLLEETINKLKGLLTPDGVLIVALPNSDSYDAVRYGKFWAAYDLPRHLYHFTRRTFSFFASVHSLKVVQVHPQKPDAYYISLLSEKYKTGSSRYLTSLWNGFRSNMTGVNPGNGYSSEIYILKMKNV